MTSTRSLFGTAALTGVSVLKVVSQIIAFPIIGHILGPESYGQIALVSPFVFLAMIIAESGLGACLIRSDAHSRDLEDAVFTYSFGLSLAIMLLFAILAYPLGHMLDEPDFPLLLIGMSSILLLAAVNVVPAARLLRAQRYDWVAGSDIVSLIGGIIGLVAGVLLGFGAWSLVAQQFMYWLGKVVVVMMGSLYVPRFALHWHLVRQNIYFGSNLTGANLLAFAARNVDNVLIGALMGATTLGYYALAFQIVCLPQMIFSGPAYSILLSSTSASLRARQSPVPQIMKTLRWLLLASAPMMVGLAVTAEFIVRLILGDQWLPTINLIILLVPFGLAQMITGAMGAALIGLGRTDTLFKINLGTATLTIVAIIGGALINNSHAVAMGVSLTSLIGMHMLLRTIAKACACSLGALYNTMTLSVIAALLMGGAIHALQACMPDAWGPGLCLCASIVVGIAAYGAMLAVLMRGSLREDIKDIRQALASKSGA